MIARLGARPLTIEIFTQSATLCEGDSVLLQARASAPGADINWTPRAGLANPDSAATMAAPGITTTYTATAVWNAETAAAQIEIAVSSLVIRNMSKRDAASGSDGAIILNPAKGVPPYLYSLDGENYGASRFFRNLEPGAYRVYAQDETGCAISRPVNIK